MFLVYVAGKFRGDIPANVAAAEAVGAALVASGAPILPVVPHSIGQRYGALRPNADTTYWLPATLELMRRCHAVVTVPGWEDSEGARGEVEEARRMGLPVFHDVAEVVAWATRAPVPEEPQDPRHISAEPERPTHEDIDACADPAGAAERVLGAKWMPSRGWIDNWRLGTADGTLAWSAPDVGWTVFEGPGDTPDIANGPGEDRPSASRAALHAYLDNKLTPPKHAPGWAAWDWGKR